MPEVHVYVSARDKALIAALPPQVTVASILRQALEQRRACEHVYERRCAGCGTPVEDLPPEQKGLVSDMAIASTGDGGPLVTDPSRLRHAMEG